MTQDEIIEMARKVGYPIQHLEWQKATEEFAALVEEKVAAKEREACADAALKAAESSIVLAMKIEREACAKLCEDGLNIATCLNALDDMEMWGEKFAKAIRARGQA